MPSWTAVRFSTLKRYVAGMGCVACAAALRWSLTPIFGSRFPYLLQFLGALAAARFFGFGPALFSLLIGTSPLLLGIEFEALPPSRSGMRGWLSLSIIYSVTLVMIWILDRHRRLRGEVESSHRLAGERLEQLSVEIERRESEQKLSAQLHAIVESSDDAIIYKDLDGIIRSWNYGAEQVYGYTAAEAIGQSIFILLPPDRIHEEVDVVERIRHGGRVKHFETVRLRKDQTPIHVSVAASPIRDQEGNIVGISHITRDITERKRLEEQIRQTQKLESLGVLTGGIAHDFNNLLTGIVGNASLALQELPDGHPVKGAIHQVLAAGDRAALLIRQMLAYAGKGQVSITRLDLSEQVAQIVPLISASLGKEVQLDLQLGKDLPPLDADAAQIQQVIMNLAINGAEAIGENLGTLTISTQAREAESEQQVVLKVRDSGCGMDEATCARIFDPFFTTKFTGRGLGLSAVLGIIRGHHGYISVDSAPGQGSTFTVVLPALSQADAPQMRGYGKVLVVDDEEVVRDVARFSLERAGFTAEVAADGRAALAIFTQRSFDAVLMDVFMPGLAGDEVARRMLAIDPRVRIVLCSDLDESDARNQFGNDGVAAFLQKPYTAAVLTRKLKQALKREVTTAPR